MSYKIKLLPQGGICPGVEYAFTVNLSSDELLHIMVERYGAFFQKIKDYVYFDMFPELSNVARKLHYHGTIIFKSYKCIMPFYDIIGQYREELAIEMDSINWNNDNVFKNWYIYCRKDRHIMYPYMKAKKLPYRVRNDSQHMSDKLHMNIRDMLISNLD